MQFQTVSSRWRAFCSLFAFFLLSGWGSATAAQDPTTPEVFFGYPIGADYQLTTYEKAMEWFDHLAQHSAGRMLVEDMGQTGMGRVHRYAVISSAENMARLEEYQETIRRLSLGRDLSPEEAEELAMHGKAIGWIDVGLHATEASPSEHVLQLAYDLVTGEDAQSIPREALYSYLLPVDGLSLAILHNQNL